MIATSAPIIDARTAADITRQLRNLLPQYVNEDAELLVKNETGKYDQYTEALIAIFSRYAEVIIERLNRVPEKNFLAFLNLLGSPPLPPQPARVPLTFNLAPGSSITARIPAGTQVAAPPGEGEEQPVVFETESELMVTVAGLAALRLIDPAQDKYADHEKLFDPESALSRYPFQADHRLEHQLYIGHKGLFGIAETQSVALKLTLNRPMQDEGQLAWEYWDGSNWQEATPDVAPAEHSQDLAQPEGTGNTTTLSFSGIAPLPLHSITIAAKDVESRWLRCRLVTPITPETTRRVAMVRSERLPTIEQLTIEAHVVRDAAQGLLAQPAFTNATPLDASRQFLPFGEQPKRYDTFYLASSEAFSKTGGSVTLVFELDNPHHETGVTSVWASLDLQLAWESWDGNGWYPIGISQAPNQWLSLVEIEAVSGPTVKVADDLTQTVAVLQGRIQEGVSLKVTGGAGINSLISETDQFAVEVLLDPGYNVINVTAGSPDRSQSVFTVVRSGIPDPEVYLKVTPKSVSGEQVVLKVDVDDRIQNGGVVVNIRATNGHTGEQLTEPLTDTSVSLTLPLTYGRNTFLIEALNREDNPVAAEVQRVGLADPNPLVFPAGSGEPTLTDGTHALCQSGQVKVELPQSVDKTVINGQENYWVRVRIIQGHYGKAAEYRLMDPLDAGRGYALTPATFKPPLVSKLSIGYDQLLDDIPQIGYTHNGGRFESAAFSQTNFDPPLAPFTTMADEWKTLHFGFSLPAHLNRFPNTTIRLFARMADYSFAEQSVPFSPFHSDGSDPAGALVSHRFQVTNPRTEESQFQLELFGMGIDEGSGSSWQASVTPQQITLKGNASAEVTVEVRIPESAIEGDTDQGYLRLINENFPNERFSAAFLTRVGGTATSGDHPELVWQYWDGEDWSNLAISDHTEQLTRSGSITFLAPDDFSAREQFGQTLYWLRVRWESGRYKLEPRLRWLSLNTTMASQSLTLQNEVLGSSNGTADQAFKTTRAPMLDGSQLVVREPERPSAEELIKLKKEVGSGAVEEIETGADRATEFWVCWHQMPDFYASGPRDRHYILDHQSGEIRFGNGANGMIPPVGTGSIRMRRYQTGGGRIGNKAAGSIVQLKTTLPYIESVINPDAGAGGAEAESTERFLERSPRSIRHRDRAVTVEDYEDLAMLASPRVARSKGVPLYHLTLDPDASIEQPGVVSVIIVPRSDDAKPQPTQELTGRVQDYLAAHNLPTAQVVVVGPEYIRVSVEVEIVVESLGAVGQVVPAVEAALNGFLHPLQGGGDGKGWDFGRTPLRSDFYALLEAVAGVKYVRTLDWTLAPERDGLEATQRFLIYAGTHKINLAFETG